MPNDHSGVASLSVERLEKQIEERQSIQFRFRSLQEGTYPIEIERPSEMLDLSGFEKEILRVLGTVTRKVDRLIFDLKISAEGEFECTRCLEPTTKTVRTDVHVEFNPPQLGQVEDEFNHTYDPTGKAYVDLYDDIRDALALAIPMKVLCKQDCKGICPGCGTDLNKAACVCEKESPESEWAALKTLQERLRADETKGSKAKGKTAPPKIT
jgi:uncharacterized protein